MQGPRAKAKAATLFTDAQRQAVEGMKPFFGVQAGDLFIATTGYTGEAGYEIAMPNEQAADFWRGLLDAGVKPCGLGARDTLRLGGWDELVRPEMDEGVSRWRRTWAGLSHGSPPIVTSSAAKRWRCSVKKAPSSWLAGDDRERRPARWSAGPFYRSRR